jgi:KDO2-lipid IV(A) lauroyltransferase
MFGVDTRHSNRRTHRLIVDMRRSHGITVLPPEQPLRDFLKVLDGRNVVGFPADQDGGRDGVFVDFFGRPASTRRALALIALRRGCPVVPGFVVRETRDHHRLVLGKAMWADRSLGSEAAVVDLTQRLTKELEGMIRRYPQLYFWVHRRWKTRPPNRAPASAGRS